MSRTRLSPAGYAWAIRVLAEDCETEAVAAPGLLQVRNAGKAVRDISEDFDPMDDLQSALHCIRVIAAAADRRIEETINHSGIVISAIDTACYDAEDEVRREMGEEDEP
jgi:hypothetical protein